jgi:hypothetical protein
MEFFVSVIAYLMTAVWLCKINLRNWEPVAAALSFVPILDLYSIYKVSWMNFIIFFLIPWIVSIIASFIGWVIWFILLIYVLINAIIVLHNISINNWWNIWSTILLIFLPPIGFLYLWFKK